MALRELDAEVRGEVIVLRGDLNATAAPALEAAYGRAAAEGTGRVVLDLSGTDYISSTGIALVVGVLAAARAQGVAITARGLSEHYREIFEITRLADFMTIEGSSDG